MPGKYIYHTLLLKTKKKQDEIILRECHSALDKRLGIEITSIQRVRLMKYDNSENESILHFD